jgi:hypothetical protein
MFIVDERSSAAYWLSESHRRGHAAALHNGRYRR